MLWMATESASALDLEGLVPSLRSAHRCVTLGKTLPLLSQAFLSLKWAIISALGLLLREDVHSAVS